MGPCKALFVFVVLYMLVLSQAAVPPPSPSPPLIVKQSPSEVIFHVAESGWGENPFMIQCEALGEPAPSYRWTKNGEPFELSRDDDRITQPPGRGTLIFSHPRNEDKGEYQCFASNEWGTATSKPVFVQKAVLKSFETTAPKWINGYVLEGTPLKLTCDPPEGYPKPEVYWRLQGDLGQFKTINDSRITVDPEGNLLFSYVTRQDASVEYGYICVAKSRLRNEYKLDYRVHLKVEKTKIDTASITHEPVQQYVTRKEETAIVGQRTELHCIYGGKPIPHVVWKNKRSRTILSTDPSIPIDPDYSQGITQDNNGKTLVIKNTTLEDEGLYTCKVSNGVGTAQSYSIRLNVMAAPHLIASPQFQYLKEGDTALISCVAVGTPDPQIAWTHNGRPISEPIACRIQVKPHGLEISDLAREDAGNYGCNATNSVGYVYKEGFIMVSASSPTKIKEAPQGPRSCENDEDAQLTFSDFIFMTLLVIDIYADSLLRIFNAILLLIFFIFILLLFVHQMSNTVKSRSFKTD